MSMNAHFQLLHRLPTELLLGVLEGLRPHDLKALNRVDRWAYRVATPLIWKDVQLVDCRSDHSHGTDEHDDTPLIRKLILLVRHPWLAECVHSLSHRCHLPLPNIFSDLPHMTFSAQTLSTDPRTIKLLQLAVDRLINVHTLCITLGHPTLTDALLRCFFDVRRTQAGGYTPVRRLWLENCRVSVGLTIALSNHPYDLPLDCLFTGLESIRFRRLPLKPGMAFKCFHHTDRRFNYSRGGHLSLQRKNNGGEYLTTIHLLKDECRIGEKWIESVENTQARPDEQSPIEHLFAAAHAFDDLIYQRLATEIDLPAEIVQLSSKSAYHRSVQAYRGNWLDPDNLINSAARPVWKNMQREKMPSAQVAMAMLRNTSRTLTSLNLDQVFTTSRPPYKSASWCSIFSDLLTCRFPHLRAFQVRNCNDPETLLPSGLYLLDPSQSSHEALRLASNSTYLTPPFDPLAGLAFMEAHPNLQSLSWPICRFFGPGSRNPDIAERVDAVIENLGRTLTHLRVDTEYEPYDELLSEEDQCRDVGRRESRRRLIADLAPRMTKLESIKMESSLPRDERRELARALYQCPLQKIVMIGFCNPLGNSWGADRAEMDQVTVVEGQDIGSMEGEDNPVVYQLGVQELVRPSSDFAFRAEYRWRGIAPMLHVLASYHAETVRELKFCGYRGCPILFTPTPITHPLLAALRHFHHLESLVISIWLPTFFEGGHHDSQIVACWRDRRDLTTTTTTTALGRTTDSEAEAWEGRLRQKYSPEAVAREVTTFIGPYISNQAKQRTDGVHVRASFCVGNSGKIFDLDLHIRNQGSDGDVCLGFTGPLEPEWRKSKLEMRMWF